MSFRKEKFVDAAVAGALSIKFALLALLELAPVK